LPSALHLTFNYLICFYIRQQLRVVRARAIAGDEICRRTIDHTRARAPQARNRSSAEWRSASRAADGIRAARKRDGARPERKKIFVISVSGSKKIGSRRLRSEKNRAPRVAN